MLVSILGDSISTYIGYNPPNYKLFYDENISSKNGLKTVADTWWHQVISYFDCQLLINASYSGSKCSGENFPSANSIERINALHNNHVPDIILVYIGFNDFAYGAPLKRKNIFQFKSAAYFQDAYTIMLHKLNFAYPKAKIFCATLAKTYIKNNINWCFPEMYNGHHPLKDYNSVIRIAVRKHKFYLVELGNLYYETLDGSHPTKKGHKSISEQWITGLKNFL